MVNIQTRPQRLSFEDYLEIERKSDVRYEFIDGVLYAMVGATDRHELVAMNLASALHVQLRGRCQVFKGDMKVKVRGRRDEDVYYPDVLVSCDPLDRASLWRERPCLIIEVASPSTEAFDRGKKFDEYRRIDSLEEYVLVSQDSERVEIFHRRDGWKAEARSSGAAMTLESVNFTCAIADIYEGVDLAPRDPSI